MDNIYDLKSILNAIEDINNNSKKKTIPLVSNNFNELKKNNPAIEEVLPITEKLILEAEEYSNKLKKNSLNPTNKTKDILILDKEYNDQNLENINLEEIKNIVIDDLYSSLSKKVKKNTIKIIFDLRQKINDLEKKLEFLKINNTNVDITEINNNTDLKINKEHLINKDKLEVTKEHLINEDSLGINEEHLINEDSLGINEEHFINEDSLGINEEHLINQRVGDLSEDTIKTLRHQNSVIKNFEKNEEKLRLKIVDLEQDITLLGDKKIKSTHKVKSSENVLNQSITKSKSELIFFKENYEKLIIVNDNLKKKLINSNERIIIFEKNIKELENGFENLRNILSKNSVIKLNDPILKTQSKIYKSKKD